jgi:predicted ester cyclase
LTDKRKIVARYFKMWNTGESAVAAEVLSADWLDHTHPEVTGPDGVRESVETIRAAQPNLRFDITAILADGDLVTAIGEVGTTKLVWVVRLDGDRMAEMRTYREMS